jgi:hypothetical protein
LLGNNSRPTGCSCCIWFDADPTWTWRLSWHDKPPVRDQPGRVSYYASAENYDYSVVGFLRQPEVAPDGSKLRRPARLKEKEKKKKQDHVSIKVAENID